MPLKVRINGGIHKFVQKFGHIMEAIPTLGYRNIYKSEPQPMHDLLKEIPSSLVIAALSKVNALLFLNRHTVRVQFECINLFTSQISDSEYHTIQTAIKPLVQQYGNNFTIFHYWYTLKFIEYELLNFRDFKPRDLTSKEELNIFKAYLSIVDSNNATHIAILKGQIREKGDPLFFQKTSWPLLFEQYLFNIKEDPAYLSIRSISFYSFLENNYQTELKNFLSIKSRSNYWDYVGFFVNLAHLGYQHGDDNEPKTLFMITKPKPVDSLTEDMCINIEEFKKDKRKTKDFLGLRENPSFTYENNYVIVHWGFLLSKLYLGALFDFYKQSGIKAKFDKIPDFLSEIAKKFSEEIFFRGILNRIFTDKSLIIHFDDGNSDGQPDCYVRINNIILLIEFKDALLAAETISSGDYSSIAEDINKKFILNDRGKAKGITQIVNQVKYLTSKQYEFDDFQAENIICKDLIIYPIIVYTHSIYSVPGVNDYLNKRLTSLLEGNTPDPSTLFKKVMPLTMIDIEFICKNFKAFQQDNKYFINLMDQYHSGIADNVRRMKLDPSSENVMSSYEPFEIIVGMYHGDPENRNFVAYSELLTEFKVEIPEEIKNQTNGSGSNVF